MRYTENALNVLTAQSYKGIGKAWVVQNLSAFESLDSLIDRLNRKGAGTTIDEFLSKRKTFQKTIESRFENICDGFVAIGDEDFPIFRGKVKGADTPVFLYYKGNLELLSHSPNVSVIGVLNPTNEVEKREREIVKELVKSDAVIVSGLALGCDSISHKQTIESGGKTVAILPSPLNDILPSQNKDLAEKIVEEGGLLITEYGNKFKDKYELAKRYIERDRLQAMFCDTILLSASYAQDSNARNGIDPREKLDCGSRHAMGKALEYGISRAVMYDDGDSVNPMFDLNRDIISEDTGKKVKIVRTEGMVDTVREIIDSVQTNIL